MSYALNHPNFKVERISKSNLLASRESTREMLNSCHMVLLYKHSTLEITMQRMSFNAADYPEDDRITIDKPKTKSTASTQQLIKKAIEKDVKASVQILAGYLLPAREAKRSEAKQPIEELVVRLINATANVAIIRIQQEQKEKA